MYDELVKRLRECTAEQNGEKTLWHQAADAIEELQKDLERSKDFEAFWQHEAEEALKKFQVAISNKPRWIPVTEQLPEKDDDVLMYAEWTGVSGTIYKDILLSTISELKNMGYRVTHWMPIPQPPESGDSLSCGIRNNVQQKSTVDNAACSDAEPSEKVQDGE